MHYTDLFQMKKDERAALAEQHILNMRQLYSRDTLRSAQYSRVFDENVFFRSNEIEMIKEMYQRAELECINLDPVSIILEQAEGKTVVLDLASFKHPGGKFQDGRLSYEECLCHCSNLYNVLKMRSDYYDHNRDHKNHGLYETRALYVPDILIESGDKLKCVDVVACSAPNKRSFEKFYYSDENTEISKDPDEYCYKILNYRCSFLKTVIEIASGGEIDTLILGPWGCNSFGNNTDDIADLLLATFSTGIANRVIFAILPEEKETYKIFQEKLENKNSKHPILQTY